MEKAAIHRRGKCGRMAFGETYLVMVVAMRVMAPKRMVAISQPIREWVIVLCPKRLSRGTEMNGINLPIVDLGISTSGIREPRIAMRIIVQWRLMEIPKMPSSSNVNEDPKTMWLGASISFIAS